MRSGCVAALFLLAACGDTTPAAPAASAQKHAPVPGQAAATAPGDPAVALFERRVAESPGDAPSRAVLAHLYLRRWELHGDPGDLARAEAVAGDAARLDPENAQAVAHRARALAGLHRFDDAIAACDAWLGARGPNVFVLEAKADAALAAGRVVLAREVADALLARSEDAPAILLQGLLAEVAGDSSRGAVLARDAARTAASGGMLPHEIARFHVAAGEMACRAGRSAEAKSDFDLALTACRDHAGALGGLADLAAAEGRLPEARELAGRAAAQRPAPRELFRVSLLGGIEAEAYAADVRATAMCEANPGLFGRELAEHLAARNADLERALRSIDADLAVRADPEGHALRARILLALGRLDDAAAAVAASRRFGTRTPSVLHTAARVAARRGETATARSVVAELESISPSLVPPDLRAFAGAAR